MYSEDTFFHLTIQGRIGLVMLSLTLSTLVVWLFWKISSRFKLPIKLILALIFIWAFIWLSPQAYYLYYIQLFDDLPLQNVIQFPPTLNEIVRTITFTGTSNLSNHGKGIVFWAMMLIALKQKT